jgi:hypothetical protein
MYELDFCARGQPPTWLHHTLLEVLSSREGRVQSSVGVILCDLEMMPCPHKQHLDNLRRKDSLRGAETAEISVRLGNYSASHFEGSAHTVLRKSLAEHR